MISVDGVEMYGFFGSCTPPNDPTYGGCALYLRNEAGAGLIDPTSGIGSNDILLGYMGPKDTTFQTDHWPIHATEPTWDLYFVSYDVNNQQNKLVPGTTPRVTGLNPVTATSGSLKGGRIDPTTVDPSMAIIGAKLAVNDLGIVTSKIASAAVITSKIAALNITTPLIADANITTAKIANLAVTTALIANLAVGTAQIADLAVTDAKINSLTANKITAGTISAVTITTATINGGAITGTSLALNLNGVTSTIGNTSYTGAGNAGLDVKNNTGPSRDILMTDKGFYIRGTDQATYIAQLTGLGGAGDIGQLLLYKMSDTSKTVAMNAFGLGGPQFIASDGTNSSILFAGTLQMNGNQVVSTRQTDPGAPAGWADATAQTWATNLRTALRNHGLV